MNIDGMSKCDNKEGYKSITTYVCFKRFSSRYD